MTRLPDYPITRFSNPPLVIVVIIVVAIADGGTDEDASAWRRHRGMRTLHGPPDDFVEQPFGRAILDRKIHRRRQRCPECRLRIAFVDRHTRVDAPVQREVRRADERGVEWCRSSVVVAHRRQAEDELDRPETTARRVERFSDGTAFRRRT